MEFDETLTRGDYLDLAKLAEELQRYDEVVEFVKEIILQTPSFHGFTMVERGLFSNAYKKVVNDCRSAWQIVSSIEQKEGRRSEAYSALMKDYRARIEADLSSICGEVLGLLDSHLIPSADSSESKVFYLKMKGDYLRYLTEYKVGEECRQATSDAEAAYNAAQDIASAYLAPAHPTRLGLELNFSTFLYVAMNSRETACSMAKKAFDEAMPDLSNWSDGFYGDALSIIQLLRGNLAAWTLKAQEQKDEA